MSKILILITTFFLVSCDDLNNQSYSKQQKAKVETIKTICPECKGVGKVKPSTSYKVGLAIASFGFGLLRADEPIKCEMCNGKGYVEIPKID